MTPLQIALQLVQLLAKGCPYTEKKLQQTLGVTLDQLQQGLHQLRAWGLVLTSTSAHCHQLAFPLQLLDPVVICHASGDEAIILLPVVDSTNQYLLDRRAKLRCGTACVAEYQTAGRGQQGRRWLSPFGANVLWSLYWQLSSVTPAMMGLSLALGIVTAETLHTLGMQNIKLKWPNDLYLNGRKLGGILVETRTRSMQKIDVVMGSGINITPYPAMENTIDQPWISLQESGLHVDRSQLIGTLLRAWRLALQQFEQQQLAPFLARWLAFDYFYGRTVDLHTEQGVISGVAYGINAQGALLLTHNGQLHSFTSGRIAPSALNSDKDLKHR